MRSAGVRFFVVGLLVLLMGIPLLLAGGIVADRERYSDEAEREVGYEWGGEQVLGGPQVVVPVTAEVRVQRRREVADPAAEGGTRTELFEAVETQARPPVHLYPETFEAAIDTVSEVRRRGIFEVPVYSARIEATFAFDPALVEPLLASDESAVWEAAELRVAVSRAAALRGEASITRDGEALRLEPLAATGDATMAEAAYDPRGLPVSALAPRGTEGGGVAAPGVDPRAGGAFAMTLTLNGADRLFVTPVGRSSTVTMRGDWPDPSFTGAFLPDARTVTDAGFEASWTIPHLARPLPQAAREDTLDAGRRVSAFGVRFVEPNDFYRKAYRAARYGILFIGLTFLTVLLVENRTGRPAHPVQYLLVGLAQSVWVLLLVAYAEQIGFAPAYALSSAAVIGLLTVFGFTALKLGRRGWVLCGALVVLYAVLWLILRSADYALLAGSTLAFGALAAAMWLTRNEDWYGPAGPGAGLFRRRPAAPAALPSADPAPASPPV